ncbi:MAG: DNA polymerase III subunit gamma/tau, partial [Proteobacteria bacterium]|nr:DNA polymerase III subunit gamma/tau [Pseudomonadota bacterium]
LAHGADGSLRDGLSLLDQAIAYTAGKLDEVGVRAMLGSVDRQRVDALLVALAAGDGTALLREVETLAGFSPDFAQVLDALAASLHRISLRQLVPGIAAAEDDGVEIATLAVQVTPELVQLWYQMAIAGRRDLPLAPSPRTGIEMSLLRMLAFRPAGTNVTAGVVPPALRPGPPAPQPAAPAAARAGVRTHDAGAPPRAPLPVRDAAATPAAMPAPQPDSGALSASSAAPHSLRDVEQWMEAIAAADLKGPVRDLAAQAGFISHTDGVLTLALPAGFAHLRNAALTGQLAQALAGPLGGAPQIVFATAAAADTLHARNERARDQRQTRAESEFTQHPSVQRYLQQFGAKLVPDSIRPIDDN